MSLLVSRWRYLTWQESVQHMTFSYTGKQCCGCASLWCGSGFGSYLSLWCGSGSYLSIWCGSGSTTLPWKLFHFHLRVPVLCVHIFLLVGASSSINKNTAFITTVRETTFAAFKAFRQVFNTRMPDPNVFYHRFIFFHPGSTSNNLSILTPLGL